MQEQEFKRHIAHKFRIGDILSGKPVMDADRFKFTEIGDKKVARVNIIANVIEKFVQDGEKKFASVTLDDASGQIRIKTFGEDIEKFSSLVQGDTIQIIGLLRSWNNEIYITPEIIKKRNPEFLLLRKLETDLQKPKQIDKSQINTFRDSILSMIKKEESNGGIETEKIVNELKTTHDLVNSEVKRLLEDGLIYEPRPGKLRYLG